MYVDIIMLHPAKYINLIFHPPLSIRAARRATSGAKAHYPFVSFHCRQFKLTAMKGNYIHWL